MGIVDCGMEGVGDEGLGTGDAVGLGVVVGGVIGGVIGGMVGGVVGGAGKVAVARGVAVGTAACWHAMSKEQRTMSKKRMGLQPIQNPKSPIQNQTSVWRMGAKLCR